MKRILVITCTLVATLANAASSHKVVPHFLNVPAPKNSATSPINGTNGAHSPNTTVPTPPSTPLSPDSPISNAGSSSIDAGSGLRIVVTTIDKDESKKAQN